MRWRVALRRRVLRRGGRSRLGARGRRALIGLGLGLRGLRLPDLAVAVAVRVPGGVARDDQPDRSGAVAFQHQARAAGVVARRHALAGDDHAGVDRGLVEQDLGVGHRQQRGRVDHERLLAVLEQAAQHHVERRRLEQLGGVGRQDARGQHLEVGQLAQRPLEQVVGVAAEQRVRHPALVGQAERPGQARVAQVELDEDHLAPAEGDRLGEPDRDARLALAADRARDHHGAHRARHPREVDGGAQDAERLEVARAGAQALAAERLLRHDGERAQPVLALEAGDVGDPLVHRLDHERGDEAERQPDDARQREHLREPQAGGVGRDAGLRDHARVAVGERVRGGEPLERLAHVLALRGVDGERLELLLQVALGGLDALPVGARPEGHELVGEGVGDRGGLLRLLVAGRDLKHVGVLLGLDVDLVLEVSHRGGQPERAAHARRDRLGAGQQDVGRRLALGVVVGALELEGGVGQRRRAEQDASAAVVAVAGADAGDHHADGEAGDHGQHDDEPAPSQHAERVAHGVAVALGLEAQIGGGAHLAAPSGACSSRTSVISARKRARPKRRALARKR